MVMTCTAAKVKGTCGGRTTIARLDDPEVVLMLRVRGGDDGAFSELLERYWRQVFGRFYRRLGDRQEAEDLAQDVFLRLYRYRQRYEPRAKFATWLFHIAQNVLRNALRSKRRHACVRLGGAVTGTVEGEGLESPRHTPCDSPSRPLEQAETSVVVRRAVSGLGDRQRVALELHQFQDRTCAEIAEEMDMSPKAAKSLLYRARHQLRGTLQAFVECGA